jgi:hypothetical protein
VEFDEIIIIEKQKQKQKKNADSMGRVGVVRE